MKTVRFEGKNHAVTYIDNSGLYTRCGAEGMERGQYGADVYKFDNDATSIILVPTKPDGDCLRRRLVIISKGRYEALKDEKCIYCDFKFHNALMSELGFD